MNITCVAVGSPMPYVKWMLGAEDLTPEDDMPIGRNVLELTDVRQSANYTCVAMSTLGVIEAVAQITVKGKHELFLHHHFTDCIFSLFLFYQSLVVVNILVRSKQIE